MPDLPIGGTWYYRIEATGEIAEISVKVMSIEDWEASGKASDPTWRPLEFNGTVLAVKVMT